MRQNLTCSANVKSACANNLVSSLPFLSCANAMRNAVLRPIPGNREKAFTTSLRILGNSVFNGE
jgi:hypothetical protein